MALFGYVSLVLLELAGNPQSANLGRAFVTCYWPDSMASVTTAGIVLCK